MDESINYTTSVSKLKYFPYKTSVELLSAYHTNEIQLGVDRGVARQWAMYNSNSPFLLKLISRILTFSPYAIILFLFVFYIFTNNWYWLVSTPLIYFAVDILNPGSFVRYGVLRNIFKAFIIVILFVSILFNIQNLFVLGLSLMFQWICIYAIYRISQYYILNYGLKNELTVCQLWEGNALNIFTNNGDRLTLKWKEIKGKITWYEDDNLNT